MKTGIGDAIIFLILFVIILFSIVFIGQKEALEIEKKYHKPSIYNLNE